MTQLSRSALKLFFETGDIPTESNFADLIDSTPNFVSDNVLTGFDSNVAPDAGGIQSTAYQITAAFNQINSSSGDNSAIKLPTANKASVVYIQSLTNFTTLVYPFLGETILGASTNAPFTIHNYEVMVLTADDDSTWSMLRYNSLVEAFSYTGIASGIVDVTPSDQSTAVVLQALFNNIDESHSTTGAVKLPPATNGVVLYLANDGDYPSNVWCPNDAIFTHSGTDGFVPILSKSNAIFMCLKDGRWTYYPGFTANSSVNYKEYVAKLSQSGTAAPTAVIVSNSLGVITWTRNTAGAYQGTLTGAFTDQDKVVLIMGSTRDGYASFLEWNNADSIGIFVEDFSETGADNSLNDTSVIIRVYN